MELTENVFKLICLGLDTCNQNVIQNEKFIDQKHPKIHTKTQFST